MSQAALLLLVVVGFTAQGRREVLDWRIGDSESEACWGEVFRSLKDRDLRGVKLLVSYAHGGIRAAIARHLQGVAWQRCRVHFKRELTRKVGYKRIRELLQELSGGAPAATAWNACVGGGRWPTAGRRVRLRCRRCCGRAWRTA